MSYLKARQKLRALKNNEIATQSQRFFKTGVGEYGEGDLFLGVRVPKIRKIATSYKHLSLTDLKKLLSSTFHEERFLALAILVLQYKKSTKTEQKNYYDFYLANKKHINNWDLIDTSAHHIIGHYLFEAKDTTVLKKLALSKKLWDRRIAIIATFYFIKNKQYQPSLQLSRLLLSDTEDLIHKAVGWMLREIGKRNLTQELLFLDKYAHKMPRVMLRYAIEHLSDKKRQNYLKRKQKDA